jgi:hypothetical protein
MENLAKKKDLIIVEKIEKLGIDLSIWSEKIKAKRIRFNPFLLEQHGNTELIYYNDGSENGLFVVGFSFTEPRFDEINEFKINASFNVIEEEPIWNKLKTN